MIDPIQNQFFGLATHRIQLHAAEVPGNTPPESLTDPRLWSNIKARCKMGDHIDVIADDYSFHAELIVTHAGGGDLRTKLLRFVPLEEVDHDYQEEQERFFVKMRGGPRKWSVMDREDGSMVMEGFANQSQAIKWMEGHVKAIAA